MKAIIQRVKNAKISCDGNEYEQIDKGFVVFIGFSARDSRSAINKIVKKIVNLRILSDEEDKMNLSLESCKGELMIVPNFTIYASTVHGNRPSFDDCMQIATAKQFYDEFVEVVKSQFNGKLVHGIFQSDMQVVVHNDGPINIVMEYFE